MSEKKYVCSECGKVSTGDEWNETTISQYPGGFPEDVTKIEKDMPYSYFYCPSCHIEQERSKIKEAFINGDR